MQYHVSSIEPEDRFWFGIMTNVSSRVGHLVVVFDVILSFPFQIWKELVEDS